VLNDKGRIDPDTRARVKAIAHDLGYRPNRSAQSLRLGRTGTIGLLLPHLANVASRELLNSDWYAGVSIAVARAAFARDRALLLLPVDNDPARFLPLVDGVIAVDPMERDPRLATLDKAGGAIVTLDFYDPSRRDFRYVLPDSRSGVRSLLEHLRDRGARQITAFYAKSDWAPLAHGLHVYRAWMAEQGLPERLEPVEIAAAPTIEALHESAYHAARALLSSKDRPDAIIALFGGFGVDAARAARDLGLDCPGELMIAQDIDGTRERITEPPITAIDLRSDLQAAAAVDMLLSILDGEEPQEPVITPVDLNIRASTGRSRT
ncbi:MAG TPA: LacI family DNA-binding transcriptional regulator, partial [Caulobacteraceae bacterium]|nr:LacI family DNA-binding transcriptional regulator [Caulobacteraceae bacterium]